MAGRVRQFSHQDQLDFAELSGDYNVIHIDPVASRRLMFGGQVVHGLHLVMWALELISEKISKAFVIKVIKVDFLSVVKIDTICEWESETEEENCIRLFLKEGDRKLATLMIRYGLSVPEKISYDMLHEWPSVKSREWLEEELKSIQGNFHLAWNQNKAISMFPMAVRNIPHIQLVGLLASTRLVGMECPGSRSIYSSFELHAVSKNVEANHFYYQVSQFSKAASLVVMKVAFTGMEGNVKAFLRPFPVRQESFVEVKERIISQEFSGQKALVVGGSRGLGELVVKCLVAGGAEVRFTYNDGLTEAKDLVAEIETAGDQVGVEQLNVLDFPEGVCSNFQPTHMYYFATPSIISSRRNTFSFDRFDLFCQYYVSGFCELVERLIDKGGLEKVFYPSTVFVDDQREDMLEYTAAKKVGEIFCRRLMTIYKNVHINCPRLPRLLTDQTQGLIPIQMANGLEEILKHLRCLERANER